MYDRLLSTSTTLQPGPCHFQKAGCDKKELQSLLRHELALAHIKFHLL
jgi:hypothetical protein